jgi:hypothetical protein
MHVVVLFGRITVHVMERLSYLNHHRDICPAEVRKDLVQKAHLYDAVEPPVLIIVCRLVQVLVGRLTGNPQIWFHPFDGFL